MLLVLFCCTLEICSSGCDLEVLAEPNVHVSCFQESMQGYMLES